MNKYDAIFNEIQRRVDNGDITLEKAEKLNDMAYELYAEAFEGDLKINKLLGDCRKEYQDNIKDIKKAIKAGNITVAKRNIQSAKKNIVEAKKIVDKIPTDESDDTLGYLVETANAFVKITLADMILTGIVAGTTAVVAVSSAIKAAEVYGMDITSIPGASGKTKRQLVSAAGVSAGTSGATAPLTNKKAVGQNATVALIGAALATLIRYKKGKDINYYKSYAKKQFDRCMKHLDKLDKKLDKKAFKESCEYDESSSNDLFISNILDCYLEEVITDDEFINIMESCNDYM
jgi:hypothetical protein